MWFGSGGGGTSGGVSGSPPPPPPPESPPPVVRSLPAPPDWLRAHVESTSTLKLPSDLAVEAFGCLASQPCAVSSVPASVNVPFSVACPRSGSTSKATPLTPCASKRRQWRTPSTHFVCWISRLALSVPA